MLKTIPTSLKKIVLMFLVICLSILVLPQLTPAQSSYQLEYRISQLESQISDLRGQINSLDSRLASGRVPATSRNPSPTQPNTRRLSGDPMFDNLATLVIELKQDVNQLKTRLSQLETSRSSR